MKIESALEKRIKRIIGKPNKDRNQDAGTLCRAFLKTREKNLHLVNSLTEKLFDVDEYIEEKCICYRLIPKNGFNGNFIFYIYGGVMSLEITKEQWYFINDIASKSGCGILIPMYPLAPEYSSTDVFNMLYTTYVRFAKSRDVQKTILIGDSFGAGLIVSLSLMLWENGLKKPDQMILVTPILDTEYYDKEIENKLIFTRRKGKCNFYSSSLKAYLNNYWVKENAVKTKITSPIYEDYTDICDDIVILTGADDVFKEYAIRFYEKVKAGCPSLMYLEYTNMPHDFIMVDNIDKSKTAKKHIIDCITRTYESLSSEALYPIKARGEWVKKFPDLVRDNETIKWLCNTKFDFQRDNLNSNEFANILMASRLYAFDKKIKDFIIKFPYATIVEVGVGMSTTFNRVDNNRINWCSVDSPGNIAIRRKYLQKRDREIYIDKNIFDYTWLDIIKCNSSKGILFVCCESLITHSPNDIQALFNQIRNRFSGSELIFDCTVFASTVYKGLYYSDSFKVKKAKLCINDAYKTITDWSITNHIIAEEPIMKNIKLNYKTKLATKAKIVYNLISGNYKLIHLKLGHEKYEVDYM